MRVFKFACAFVLALGLMGCAGGGYHGGYDDGAPAPGPVASLAPPPQPQAPAMTGTARVDSIAGQKPLQCVPYARDNSAIKIFGDANTWWDQAASKYERGASPAPGTVMVLHNYSAANTGHVGVVRRIVGTREIRIDHANWTNDGSIYLNNPVQDVSPANDWSQVKVFNIKTGSWGAKVYPVQGFIGSGSVGIPDIGKPMPPARATPRLPLEDAPDALPGDEDAAPDIDALLAAVQKSAPQARIQAAAAPRAVLLPVAGSPERNPPAGSPYALTADDLAIP